MPVFSPLYQLIFSHVSLQVTGIESKCPTSAPTFSYRILYIWNFGASFILALLALPFYVQNYIFGTKIYVYILVFTHLSEGLQGAATDFSVHFNFALLVIAQN